MTLLQTVLSESLRGYAPWRELNDRLRAGPFPFNVAGPRGSYFAFIASHVAERSAGSTLIIVPTEQEAESLAGDLRVFGADPVLIPWWGSMPYRPLPRTAPVFGDRARALSTFFVQEKSIVVCSLRCLLTPVPDPGRFRSRLLTIRVGDSFDPVDLARKLERAGYSRVPKVTVRGEFALRGEVLDFFQPGDSDAIRIVFEWDEIEQIRRFQPETQNSTGSMTDVLLHPEREVVWDAAEVANIRARIPECREFRNPEPILEQIGERGWIEGEEIYFPLADSRAFSLIDYLPDATVLIAESDHLAAAYDALEKEYQGLYASERVRRDVPKPNRILLRPEDALSRSSKLISFPALGDGQEPDTVRLPTDPPRSFFGNVGFLKEEVGNLATAGFRIIVYAESESQASRIGYLLKDLPVDVVAERLTSGFGLPDQKILVIEENEIFGRRRRAPRSVQRARSEVIETFVDLSPGDFVVHVNYGIGRFNGISRIAAAGNERDYIHLEYAGDEFIYIPIEQVNLIQRYIGHSGEAPRLDKIGGKSWENRKSRVRRNVEDLAERLVRLYSRRKRARGFAFPDDTEWQVQFEATFPYEETEDQITCIAEVKSDMEKPVPMDRLVCGDVGYGKTEIGLRAAFKAVSSGKQVALLAPTTILAEQHFETFAERLKEFPVSVGMLSRFVPRKEQQTVLSNLAGGSLDIIIGTHRILQKDVIFRDLGLLVVDEEQRFGVKDKERLKELKTSVDCLTLTATPIPRTLHMSLLQIRDMSILRTPPQNRMPIQTVIREFSEDLISEAIRSEVERGGQVYFLHNRVETLDNIVRFVQELVPEVIVDRAHGKMSARELEDIMHRFIHGGFHVLVSTTIIENGIDIPNVNTIIIDRADMYGISQLYQLRGRVGRSDRLAHAYLLYPDERVLSEIAMKRLQIINDYTELGSGFKIALKDLEVRGAGNLLGREQSGDILSIGFDLYLRLLDEAIRSLDEDAEPQEEEVYLELQYTGFIPDSYISEATEKMDVYKRIASIGTQPELEATAAEIEDQFGPLPDEVQSLLSLAEIRILCRDLHVASMRERKGELEVEFGKVAKISADRVVTLIQASGGSVRIDPRRPNVLVMNTGNVGLKEKSEFIRGRLASLTA